MEYEVSGVGSQADAETGGTHGSGGGTVRQSGVRCVVGDVSRLLEIPKDNLIIRFGVVDVDYLDFYLVVAKHSDASGECTGSLRYAGGAAML